MAKTVCKTNVRRALRESYEFMKVWSDTHYWAAVNDEWQVTLDFNPNWGWRAYANHISNESTINTCWVILWTSMTDLLDELAPIMTDAIIKEMV